MKYILLIVIYCVTGLLSSFSGYGQNTASAVAKPVVQEEKPTRMPEERPVVKPAGNTSLDESDKLIEAQKNKPVEIKKAEVKEIPATEEKKKTATPAPANKKTGS